MTFLNFINLVKEWVTARGYATMTWVEAKAYATMAWVEAKSYTTLTTVLAIAMSERDWVTEQGYLTTGFVDRGDPGTWDFELGDFTLDGNWHDLDLSSIVPEGTKAIAMYVLLRTTSTAKYLIFREKGNAYEKNIAMLQTVIANVPIRGDYIVSLDANRKIEYIGTPNVINLIRFCVKGWWL
ncbi:unnamed protein product [marine sediment metagenome]|uniref:Uncharacterized protein n=1 Tax=marine sediment metagenome TaxID=412755 RepID=X1LNF4_9ZZZZ